jgi:hypothetical protein
MRAICLIPISIALAGVVAWIALPRALLAEPNDGQNRTLGESDQSNLFPALRQFTTTPGTTPDRRFVQVERETDGTYVFTKVPDGWMPCNSHEPKGNSIALDEHGFRAIIRLEPVPDVEEAIVEHIRHGGAYRSVVLLDHLFVLDGYQVPRVVTCAKLGGKKFKEDTTFTEYRYFGPICVELTVIDWPHEKRTLGHLLDHLHAHYGKYEWICEQVAFIQFGKR